MPGNDPPTSSHSNHEITHIVVNSQIPEVGKRKADTLYVLKEPSQKLRITVKWRTGYSGPGWIDIPANSRFFGALSTIMKSTSAASVLDATVIDPIRNMINEHENAHTLQDSLHITEASQRSSNGAPFSLKLIDLGKTPQDEKTIYIVKTVDGKLCITKKWLCGKTYEVTNSGLPFLLKSNAKYNANTGPDQFLKILDPDKCNTFLEDRRREKPFIVHETSSQPAPLFVDQEEKSIKQFFNRDFLIALQKLDGIFNKNTENNFTQLISLLKKTDSFDANLPHMAAAVKGLKQDAILTGCPFAIKWTWRLGLAFAAAVPLAYCGTMGTVAISSAATLALPATVTIGVGAALALFGLWGGYKIGKAISQCNPKIAKTDHIDTLLESIYKKGPHLRLR